MNEPDDEREDRELKLRCEQHGGTQKVEKSMTAQVEEAQLHRGHEFD